MKTSYLTSFLFIVSLSLFCQTREELDDLNEQSKGYACVNSQVFDSLSNIVLAKAKNLNFHSQLGTAQVYKAYTKRCVGKNREAINLLQEAISHFEIEQDIKGKIKALNHLASSLISLSKIDSATYYSDIELRLAMELGDSLTIANSYLLKSSLHTMTAQNDSIIFYSLMGLAVLGDIQNDNMRGSLNISIGNAYYQNEDFSQAIKYFKRAEKYFAEESINMGRIYHNLGSAFTQVGQFDSSFYYFFKTIPINKKQNRKLFLAFNYQALAHNYAETGDCKKSIEYNLLAMAMSDEVGEIRSKAGVLANISDCYVKTGQLDKAIESAKKAVALTKENGDQDKEADAYFLLSEAYKAQGKFKEAFEAHKSFYSLDSLLLNRDKQSTIATLETEYETERKEAEIELLSQQTSIQSLEIKQKNQAIIIGIVIVLFALAALYFFYKQRETKKLQSQTELEQRFLRSQLNPHFISNALVAVQSFMLKNDSESAALYLTKFSKLMREILENSRKEFIPVEEEINMLRNFLDIHKLRLGTFDFTIDLDENIDPEVDTIPPMFVQPFVENAIEHGISNAKGDGKIELKLKKEEGYISIEVYDNGGGLVSTKNENHTSLSSTIIKERMELFNRSLKKKIKLVIANLQNENGEVSGTKVELKVPYGYI